MARYVFHERVPLSCIDLPDGSMLATGTLASVGVMKYPWGLEAVGEDCLADPEWIRTAHAPLVLEHPPGQGAERFLDAEKIRRFSDPDYDGPGKVLPGSARVWWDADRKADKIEVRVFDPEIAEGIRRGMYELSPGYLTPEIDDTPGTLDGQQYDTRQRRRVGNHIALVLAKEFGGTGGRGADARFDAGDSGTTGGIDMTPEDVKKMIAEALAAFRAEDEGKDKELIKGMIDEALKAIQGGEAAESAALKERLDKCDAAMARYDAFMASKEEKGEIERTDAEDKKPAPEKDEEEARMDAADEANVLKLAGARGMDAAQPVAKLRQLLLEGTGYESRSRGLQRVYVGELAKHARADAADPFGFKQMPVVTGGQPRVLQDRATRLEERGKK